MAFACIDEETGPGDGTGDGTNSGNNTSAGTNTNTTPVNSDTTPPGEVTGLSYLPRNNKLIVNWTAPTNGDFSHIIIGYSDGAAASGSVTVTNGPADITGLQNGTAYSLLVKTVDTNGNMSAGTVLSGTPYAQSLTVTFKMRQFLSNFDTFFGGWPSCVEIFFSKPIYALGCYGGNNSGFSYNGIEIKRVGFDYEMLPLTVIDQNFFISYPEGITKLTMLYADVVPGESIVYADGLSFSGFQIALTLSGVDTGFFIGSLTNYSYEFVPNGQVINNKQILWNDLIRKNHSITNEEFPSIVDTYETAEYTIIY